MDPHSKAYFYSTIKNSTRVLCYNKNGFVLAQKTLVENKKMKFGHQRKNKSQKSN